MAVQEQRNGRPGAAQAVKKDVETSSKFRVISSQVEVKRK